jgi:hypothetical protein
MSKSPTTSRLSPKDVAPHASHWTTAELEEMKAIVDGLLSASESDTSPAGNTSNTLLLEGRRGGSYIESKLINGSGPYRYLRYWHAGKRKSVYLGKSQ